MTTREELIDGLKVVRREGMRVMSGFGPDDWQKNVLDEGGTWTRKQAFAHVTATAEITPGFVGNLGSAGESTDAAAGIDINALNAQLVGAKEAMSGDEVMKSFDTAYGNLIEFIKTVPEEQLKNRTQFGELKGEVSDIMSGVLVLHSMAHIYGAGGSPLPSTAGFTQ
jgi:hypothetical protein